MNPDNSVLKTSILYEATLINNIKVVKFIVSLGVDIHVENDLILYYALKCGHLEIVKYLLEQGVNINYIETSHNSSALINSSRSGHFKIVKVPCITRY